MTESTVASARIEILERCAKRHAESPSNDWATWDRGGDLTSYDLRDHAAHVLQEEGLIEAKFLQREAFAARITFKGTEYLNAHQQRAKIPAGTRIAFLDTNILLHSIPLEQVNW